MVSYPRRTSPPQDYLAALRMLEDVAATLPERLNVAQERYEVVDEFRSQPLLRLPSEPYPRLERMAGGGVFPSGRLPTGP